MEFTTKITIPSYPDKYDHSHTFMFVGSCFTENIGNKLIRNGFNVNVNPFGILYNPKSIADSLYYSIENKKITENDIFFYNHLWHSYYHHSAFSQPEKQSCLEFCNQKIEEAHSFIKQAKILIITFGSAWIYTLKDTDIIVGNCHKVPNTQFEKRMLSPEEIVSLYEDCFRKLKKLNPNIKIILTISPIRHWKEGYRENLVSKSILHLSTYQLQQKDTDILYFPAYEIVMDELRDYRFYDTDMLHPSPLAVEYIWQHFTKILFTDETIQAINKVDSFRKMNEHKSLQPNTTAWIQHVLKTEQCLTQLRKEYPLIKYENICNKQL